MIAAIAYNQSSVLPHLGQIAEQHPRMTEMELEARGDVVTVHRPEQMTDEDIAQTMQSVAENIGESPAEALTVYGQLNYSRVMALLDDPV